MIRIILLIFCVSHYASTIFAQKTHLYFLNGRPMDFSMNNALKTVGLSYRITFTYSGSDVFDENVIQKSERSNKRTNRFMTKRSGYGAGWMDSLMVRASNERILHDSLRTIVREMASFETICKGWIEPLLIVTANYENRRIIAYDLHLIGISENDETRKWRRFAIFSFNEKQSIPEKKSCSEDLPLLFPENGIQ